MQQKRNKFSVLNSKRCLLELSKAADIMMAMETIHDFKVGAFVELAVAAELVRGGVVYHNRYTLERDGAMVWVKVGKGRGRCYLVTFYKTQAHVVALDDMGELGKLGMRADGRQYVDESGKTFAKLY